MNQLTADQLPQKVKDLLTNKLDKTVYIKADARAQYSKVEDVVDNLRAAGVDEVGLLDRAASRQSRSAKPPLAVSERLGI